MRLTNCFLQVSGRAQQNCPDSISISKCTSGLTDHINSIFLAFFIDIASMCHHLQSEAFKLETENVVNELKGSAHWVEAKLKTMESQTSIIMSEQSRLHERMQEHSVELMHEYQRLHAEMQEKIKVGISGISSTTKEVYKQLQGVASLQREMSDHQQKLVDSLSLEFVALHDKTNKISGSLTKEFSSLQAMSHEIAESLVTKFSTLHEKSHEIGNGVLRSLSGQEALLAGQGQAMEGLFGLKKLQEKALEESQAAMQELTHEAKMHQQEFLEWQKELYTVHQQLSVGSKAMLQAQEAFVSKQAAVFTSLERLFSLHNTILLESRALKTFLFYATSSIFVYMSTSAKQTYNARALIYCSLFLTFALELGLARYETSNSKKRLQQTLSFFIYPRFTFGVVAVSLLIYNIVTYRDYTTLSYQILVDLQQQTKVHSLVPTVVVEEDCQQSSTPLSRTRITPYEKALTRKILRRARACRSKF